MPSVQRGQSEKASSKTQSVGSRPKRRGHPARLTVNAGITLAITTDPPQFVKYSIAVEREVPSDDKETLIRYERMTNATLEEVVQRRAEEYVRLIDRVQTDHELETKKSSQRTRKGRTKKASPYPYS